MSIVDESSYELSGDVAASFVYDGLGRRQKKTIGASNTEFLYDGVNPVQEADGPTILSNILTGLGIDEYFTRADVPAGVTSTFLTDALGSALALADSAGTIQTEYTYEPFGRTTATGASNTNPFQFTGRENDGTGLYYYRARYYHPVFQRFLSEDPIEFEGGDINLYAYVLNNPLKFIDPYGLICSTPSGFRFCQRVLAWVLNRFVFLPTKPLSNEPRVDRPRNDLDWAVRRLTDDDDGDGIPNYRDPKHPLCWQLGNCKPPPPPDPPHPPEPPPCPEKKC